LQRSSESGDYSKIEFPRFPPFSGDFLVPDSDLPSAVPPAPPAPTTLAEHLVAISMGGILLLIGLSLWAWGIRLAVAGALAPAGWPPGMGGLLLPVALAAAAAGIGSWRLLLISRPKGFAGLSLGQWMLGLFALATLLGGLL
jgi:hypothetical protein